MPLPIVIPTDATFQEGNNLARKLQQFGDGTYGQALPPGRCMATKSNPVQTTIGTGVTLVLDSNSARIAAYIYNNGGVNIAIGNSHVTANTGIVLPPGAGFWDFLSMDAWYAAASSGTADVRVQEFV
jgi:hypothetical protein